jgi:DNA-binding NtrC family response regulator/predicted hydrocarbon binding protein
VPADRSPSLDNLLFFDQPNGRIFLRDYRMVMFSACAMGLLRKELIETLGETRARGVVKRFGYAAGLADAQALAERFPGADQLEQMLLGPALNALEGIASMQRIDEACHVDLDRGIYHVEGIWHHSYEAEQQLDLLGKASEPVCWFLQGYAQGHSSAVAGKPTLVIEHSCRGCGDPECRFSVDYDHNLGPEYDAARHDFLAYNLAEEMTKMSDRLSVNERSLREKDLQLSQLQAQFVATPDLGFGGMLGTSPQVKKVVQQAQRVAPLDTTVLILGDSGTGKELLARGIHQHSARAQSTFYAVNCAVLPVTMQEAELFGYAKGAFTGAQQHTPGVFETADGGTLLLDEVGELSASAQTQLLRVLQEGEIKRLGETRIRKVDVRILAATHRDLSEMVAQGDFREDLYYRLDVVSLTLPALRERENDVLLLAEHFKTLFEKRFDKPHCQISQAAKAVLLRYAWPGNIRELRHAMERAVIMAEDATIQPHDLPERVRAAKDTVPAPERPLETGSSLSEIEDEAERIRQALVLALGKRDRAAKLLNMGRTTLWRKIQQYNIDVDRLLLERG